MTRQEAEDLKNLKKDVNKLQQDMVEVKADVKYVKESVDSITSWIKWGIIATLTTATAIAAIVTAIKK